MQTMLRMVGFGDNAGSGFPAILAAWENEGWIEPVLEENTRLNQVTLTLQMVSKIEETQFDTIVESEGNIIKSAEKIQEVDEVLSKRHQQILTLMNEETEYSAEEIAELLNLKGSRTRQLLKELADRDKITITAATKKRKNKRV